MTTLAGQRARVSVVIPTLNEVDNLGDCLSGLGWVDQIVVVDCGSVDGSLDLARRLGADVIEQPFLGYGAQRNAGAAYARNHTILCIDADERVPAELADEIRRTIASGWLHQAYRVPRRTWVLGRWIRYCGWQRDRVIRLYDRRNASWDDRLVHEKVEVHGTVGNLAIPLDHFSYRDLPQFAAKTARYAELSAQTMLTAGRSSSGLRLLAAPLARFLRMYVLQLGFLDGIAGIIVCSLGAWGVFLKYARLWELGRISGRSAP